MYRLILILVLSCVFFSCGNKKRFSKIRSADSGIHFSNTITDNDSLNILDVENIYNGGGVGIGDFNNDGLEDIYFTGNQVSNKLYLNKGRLKFKDITDQAGVNGAGRWSRGVTVVDINNDGLMDIYVCATLSPDVKKRENILYVNTGVDADGIPHFINKAAEYGLADTVHSTMAAFFDYDNDGDLDMYLLVNQILKDQYPGLFKPILKNREHPNTDKLYRNDWNDSLRHPVFTDVSAQAGVTIEGFGHGVTIVDINADGWKDVYVTNDFISNNILYINQRNGRFVDESDQYFKHTSESSMGQDVIDINNDGLPDVIELDMNPEDNFRKKMMMNALSYQRYQNNDYFGYQYQYVRNVLQLNRGPRILKNDSIGAPVFSDVAFYSGIAETDWSWTPSVADLDNDGFRDIIVTNGFPKDVTDHDFTVFRQKAFSLATKRDILQQIPIVKISNYVYKNNGDVTFTDVTREWGMYQPSFSNGAVYADLDNDGDLDYIVNNIDDEALVYRNNSREIDKKNHYLQVKLTGGPSNVNGLGAFVELHYKGQQQVYENTPYRGYLSSVYPVIHFGLGPTESVDSVLIKWPNGKMQLLQNVKVDQRIDVKLSAASLDYAFSNSQELKNALFKDVTDSVGIHFVHRENDFIDFNIQKLLPHKLSQYGPPLSVGDIDGNGLDDLVSGGSPSYSAQLFLQQPNRLFKQSSLLDTSTLADKKGEDTGLLLFDADGDNDLDLYVASGGYENKPNTNAYEDRFYVNDGKGNFTQDTASLPHNLTSKFCVRAMDFDKDGDLDLFVAGRVDPWNYPTPVSSFIYRNDSKPGHVKFSDVTNQVARDLKDIGLVCDAVFTDFDNDGWPDLLLAGEWMPIIFLKNDHGKFNKISAVSGVNDQVGWWNTIAPGDFDNDGDIDYVIGNIGQNSIYKASDRYPVSIYAKDFDNNGSYDAFPAYFIPASQEDQTKKEYPAQTRDDIVKQMIGMRSKFQNYKSFGRATIDELFTKEQLNGVLILKANNFKSCLLRNDGQNKFALVPLPMQAQLAPLNGMTVDDFDGDGNMDILINGNDYGTEVSVGRYDAMNGLLLLGNGAGGFHPASILQSGVFLPGNGKAMVKLRDKNGNYLVAATQNRGPLQVFELKRKIQNIPIHSNEAYAVITYKTGRSQKQEFYYGSSFLSQSARFLSVGSNATSISIYDFNGKSRVVNLNR